MKNILTILSILVCVSLHAGDGFPEPEKKVQQTIKNNNHNHNHNSTTFIQVKDPDKKKDTNGFYQVLIDWSSTLVALIGFSAGYILIRRKLIESHISKIIIDIHDTNKILLNEVTDLIDLYVPKTYTNDVVNKEELENVYESIKTLFKTSQGASSDAQTALFYLKSTIQQSIKNYDPPSYRDKEIFTTLTTREVYGLVLSTLERVTFLLTQIVQIPNSIKTESGNWFDENLSPYIKDAEFTTYRAFRQGLKYDANSALFHLFYFDVIQRYNKLLTRSAFQIYNNTSVITKLVFLSDLYAPSIISATYEASHNKEVQFLYLLGFRGYVSSNQKGEDIDIVKLIYTNPSDFMLFTNGLTLDKLKTNFHDANIKDSGFDMDKLISVSHVGFEVIELEFELEYLKAMFKKNKNKVKATLPLKDGIIRKYLKRSYKKITKTKWW